jgi:hypothetical protein
MSTQHNSRQTEEHDGFFTPESSPPPSDSEDEEEDIEARYPLIHGCYWKHGSIINKFKPAYIASHYIPPKICPTNGFIPPSVYLELNSNGRATKSVFIHSSQLTCMSTDNLTMFEFPPNHVNTPEFKLFRKSHSLSEPQLYSRTIQRTFGISNEVFGLVIDAARAGKGITFNEQLDEWEPCSMLYKRD